MRFLFRLLIIRLPRIGAGGPPKGFSLTMLTFGQPHRHVPRCESTNDLARDWARDPDGPAPSGAVVSTDFQTRGRGQRGRLWEAGPGENALQSFVYRLPAGSNPGQIGLVAAVALADALTTLGLAPAIKWPNDILLGGRKTAGILVEVSGPVAILGIGINVNQTEFDSAAAFVTPPTSLKAETGRELAVDDVREALCRALTIWVERWQQEGFLPVLKAARARLAVGAAVRRGDETAPLTGLEDDGAARVRLPSGTFARWDTLH